MSIKKLLRFALPLTMIVIIMAGMVTPAPAWQGPGPITPGPATAIALTVYNQDMALVNETRPLTLAEGINEVRYAGVPSQIDPTSVHFVSKTDPAGTIVLEQNYEYDVVGSEKLLEKYVDQEISVVTEDGTAYTGTLLNGQGDVILQDQAGKITSLRREVIRSYNFPALPAGLITRPTLVWTVDAAQAGRQTTDVSYLTRGMNWYANYVAMLADDEKSMDLNGWITLDNHSGASYEDAKLKLVAGDVNVVQPEAKIEYDMMVREVAGTAPTPAVVQRPFFEYQLYQVERPVTVSNNQTKQIEFVNGTGITTTKFFVYDGSGIAFYAGGSPIYDQGYGVGGNTDIKTMIEFRTGEASGLDAPLPAGTVRLFKKDVDGSALLIGEDRISHTPVDETVRLYAGDAFDIKGERTQTDFNRLGDDVVEESFRIVIRNHKEEDVEVRIVENLYRWSDWEIVKTNDENFTKLNAQTIEWRVPVEAGGEAEITYTVRYSF